MTRAFRAIFLATSAFLAIGAAGCATLLPVGYTEGVRLQVHNESWSPVDVQASVDGETVELGRVQPDHYPFFDLDLPEGRDAAVLVVARSSRDGELRTDTMMARPGSRVLIHLDRNPERTRWWIR